MTATTTPRKRGRITQGTYSQKTMERLRKTGYLCAKVERWVQFAQDDARRFKGPPGIRIDLFGVGDVIFIRGAETGLIQACPMSVMADHIGKCITHRIADPACEVCQSDTKRKKGEEKECAGHLAAGLWIAGGTRELYVWGWRTLLVKRGGKRVRWEPAIREITLEDLG